MRASPYDLSGFGFTPVKIETAEGRAEYVELQRELYCLAQPLRRRLLELYRGLLAGERPHGAAHDLISTVAL